MSAEELQMRLFYSGANYLGWREGLLIRLLPKFLHRFLPTRWQGRWVPLSRLGKKN